MAKNPFALGMKTVYCSGCHSPMQVHRSRLVQVAGKTAVDLTSVSADLEKKKKKDLGYITVKCPRCNKTNFINMEPQTEDIRRDPGYEITPMREHFERQSARLEKAIEETPSRPLTVEEREVLQRLVRSFKK